MLLRRELPSCGGCSAAEPAARVPPEQQPDTYMVKIHKRMPQLSGRKIIRPATVAAAGVRMPAFVTASLVVELTYCAFME